MDSYQKKLNEMKAAREQAQARSNATRAPTTGASPIKSASTPAVNSLNRSAPALSNTSTPTTPTTPTPTTPTTPGSGVGPRNNSFRGNSAALAQGAQQQTPPSPNPSTPERPVGAGSGSFRGRTTAPLNNNNINNNNNNNNSNNNLDYKSLYENEVKERAIVEEELKTLKSGASNESNAQRELNLLKTEVRVNTMKLESEVRKRESLERELAAAKDEIKTLKENTAKQANQPSVSTPATGAKSSSLAPKPGQAAGGPTRADAGPQKGNIVRASRRNTRLGAGAGGAGGAAGGGASNAPNILNMITRVLEEMQKLEGNIKKAEEGRMRAEGELLEVAMYKQASDDALDNLVTEVKQAQSAILENNALISELIIRSPPDLRAPLSDIAAKFARISDDLLAKVDGAKTPVKAEEVNKRVTIMATKLNIPPPPPMMPQQTISNAPRPPPAPGSGPTRAPTSVRGDRNSTSRASTLLDQIRRGKNLNKIDIETIQRDRENQLSSNRKSMALLASLQETLRAALNSRQDDMNLYDEEEDEEEWN